MRRMKLSWTLLLLNMLIGAFAFGSTAYAQKNDRASAEAIVERYLELHNTHRLNAVMELYAPDAVFLLNMGRDPVKGRDAIRELERFDVYARSTVQPYGLTYEHRGSEWVIHLGGVVEHSTIFSALGMVIVRAEATRDAFVISNERISMIRQPELQPACRRIAGTGFAEMTKWLVATNDPRTPDLAPDGKMRLIPGTIPIVVSAITDWRRATGWAPDPADIRQCAMP